MTVQLLFKHSFIHSNMMCPLPLVINTPEGQYITDVSSSSPGVKVRLPRDSDFKNDRKIVYNNISDYLNILYDNRPGTQTSVLFVYVKAKFVGDIFIQLHISDNTTLHVPIEVTNDISTKYAKLMLERTICNMAIDVSN